MSSPKGATGCSLTGSHAPHLCALPLTACRQCTALTPTATQVQRVCFGAYDCILAFIMSWLLFFIRGAPSGALGSSSMFFVPIT